MQLAEQAGAVVHAVCSDRNVQLVESLGAVRVFDYTVEDFTTSGERYDAVFDTVSRSSFARCRPVLAQQGCYLPTTGLVNHVLALRTAITGGPRVRTGMSVRKHAAFWRSCANCSRWTGSVSSSTAVIPSPRSSRRTGTSTVDTRPAMS